MTREEAKSELMQIYMSLSEEKKQALDVLMAQADGEYKSNKELLCDSCYRKIAGCQAKFHNPHPVDHCIEYKPIEKQADGEYISKDKMLMFLNDMRYGIAPDETVADGDERREREAQVDVLDDLMEVVEQMPSVAIPLAERKTGHWIEHPEIKTSTPEYLMFYECSECGDKQCFCKSDIHKKHFCNNCGARMVEEQEGSEE